LTKSNPNPDQNSQHIRKRGELNQLNKITYKNKNTIANTTLDGERPYAFLLISETRQGCPPLSTLFSKRILEVLATALRQGEK